MNEFINKYNEYYHVSRLQLPPFPKTMLLETTNYCNHSCIFCAHSKMTRPQGFIKKELAIRILKEAYKAGVREVGLYMFGEPLLDKNLEDYIIYAKEMGYTYVFITTNGHLLNQEKIISLIGAGLDSIKFSFNGGTKEHYLFAHGVDAFELVKNNILALADYRKKQEKNFKIFISSVLTKYTKDDGDEIRKIFGDVVDDIAILECHNQGGNMNYEIENALKISDSKSVHSEKGFCFMPYNRIHVTWEGYLTLCCVDYQNYLIIEDLNKVSLLEAWNSERFQEIRKRHLENKLENTLCYNCLYNANLEINPLAEKFAYPFCYDAEKRMKVLQQRIDQLTK